jgi:hypothetical protein
MPKMSHKKLHHCSDIAQKCGSEESLQFGKRPDAVGCGGGRRNPGAQRLNRCHPEPITRRDLGVGIIANYQDFIRLILKTGVA